MTNPTPISTEAPSDDLVERLRGKFPNLSKGAFGLLQDAADEIEKYQCALDAVMEDWFECRFALAYLGENGGLDPLKKKVATAGLCSNESAQFLDSINLVHCRKVRAKLIGGGK